MRPKVSSRPNSPATSHTIPKPARSTPMSTRETPHSVRSTGSYDSARDRTPNGRYAGSPESKKRSNTPKTPNTQSSPVTRGSDEKI